MADCVCSALAVGGPGKPLLHRAGCPTSSVPAKPSSCRWPVTPSPGLPFCSPSGPQRDWLQREGSRPLEAGCTLQASRWAHLPLHQAWFFSHTPQASDSSHLAVCGAFNPALKQLPNPAFSSFAALPGSSSPLASQAWL